MLTLSTSGTQVNGTTVEVQTPAGPVRLKVKPGPSSGQRLRLTGRGLPNPNGDPGNLYALVLVKVPAELSEAEREAYEQLARVSTFDPRAAR
jgi:curved DNA-binding protein